MDSLGVSNSGQPSFEEYKGSVEVKPVERKSKSAEDSKKQTISSEVQQGIDELNGFLEMRSAKAIISNHEVFGDTMIKIIDKKTNEVLLETPPEKILDMVAKLCEIVGLKLDKKA